MKKITTEQLAEVERLFPMPEFTAWYLNRFPKKQVKYIEVLLFSIGFVTTIIFNKNPDKKFNNSTRAAATLLFVFILLVVAVIHTIAWVQMRMVEIRRAKWLGITLREYWSL